MGGATKPQGFSALSISKQAISIAAATSWNLPRPTGRQPRTRPRGLGDIGRDDEHPARDAAAVEAGATEAVGLDDGGAQIGRLVGEQRGAGTGPTMTRPSCSTPRTSAGGVFGLSA
ncbi:hypothetical protein [Streptomyces sp. NPDC002265]|uniref:hypothetical protein n=1 Tax=Streptomyces sp. NPDC002265 TaxID=3154415 RepID=UPI00332B07C3